MSDANTEMIRLNEMVGQLSSELAQAQRERDEAYDVASKDARDSFAPILAEVEKQRDEARAALREAISMFTPFGDYRWDATTNRETIERWRKAAGIDAVNKGSSVSGPASGTE